MITLDLLQACENCKDFEAVSGDRIDVISVNRVEYHHIVTCENIDKCRALLEHLQKEDKNNGK